MIKCTAKPAPDRQQEIIGLVSGGILLRLGSGPCVLPSPRTDHAPGPPQYVDVRYCLLGIDG